MNPLSYASKPRYWFFVNRISSAARLVFVSLFSLSAAAQADWPQYRGPSQNGVSAEKALNLPSAGGPKVLWKTNVGKGTSAITVLEGRAYTIGNAKDIDTLYCFDVKTGKVVWSQQYPAPLDPKLFEGGPRSTPALDGNRVYFVSHPGDLRCLEAATGKKLWEKNLVRDFGGRRPDWGFAGSPLLSGAHVLCDAGGPGASTIALDKLTGAVAWKSGADRPGYATPVVAELGGVPTVIVFKADALVGYARATGKELWRTPWKTDYDINAATPLVLGSDRVFITSGYNAGCELLQIAGGNAKVLWKNKNLRSHINSPVATGGYIFGIDGNTGGGNLVCLDAASGDRKWEERSVKGGSLILADGKLVICSEKGELVLCEASANGFHPLSRAHVLDHRCWTQPTLDEGRLFLRNNEGDLVCLDLGAK